MLQRIPDIHFLFIFYNVGFSTLLLNIGSGNSILDSIIHFPDPMFMTLDSSHGPNAKFLKKMTGKCGKVQGKNYFSPILVFDSKTRLQIRSACKTERNL